MATSVIGLFDSDDKTQKIRVELVKAGCHEDSVAVFQDGSSDKIVKELINRGYKEDRARQYAQAVEQGGVLIAAEAEGDKAEQAVSVMNRFEALAPEELLQRAEGGQQNRGERVERAQSAEETLRVGKEQVNTGKRLVTNVTEEQVEKPVTLREENVEVERRHEERRLKPGEAEKAFQEKTVEMTATSERPVVSKEARVTEEVALRKQSGERQETVRDTVRRSEVHIEDAAPKPKGRDDRQS